MEVSKNSTITIGATVDAPIEKVWSYWNEPQHIIKWNHASDDWHTTYSENNLRVGGNFLSRMEAKDGSFGFDFSAIYDDVKLHKFIAYTLGDGRRVEITFISEENQTKITEIFEAEETNSIELQQQGWQAILNNFKNYAEGNL